MQFKKIIHVDLDYFFAQVEELKDPRLKKLPVAIGSDSPRGVLCTANYVARKFGVRSAMSSVKAKRLCPDLVFIPPQSRDYKKASELFFEVLYEFSDKVEKVSVDEAYIDVTESVLYSNSAIEIGKRIKKEILKRTGLTCSIGVSFNKFLAKYASEYNKPNGMFIIRPKVSSEFIGSIRVGDINGVGKVTQERLNQDGIFHLRDLWAYKKDELIYRYGKLGQLLYERCRAVDKRELSQKRVRKSLSVENTFSDDIYELHALEERLKKVYEEFLRRLKKYQDRDFTTVFVKIKFADFESTTVERKSRTHHFQDFWELAQARLVTSEKKAIRLIGLGVKFSDLRSSEAVQLMLPLAELHGS